MLKSPLRQVLRDVAGFLYPPRCICCEAAGAEDDPAFCPDCRLALSALLAGPACPRCAAPLPPGSACPRCDGEGIYPFEKVVALGPFREPLRDIIHRMKYHHRWPIAEIIAAQMLQQPRVRQLLDETDVLVPVPLHWSRQIARGYNQSAAIARHLIRHRPDLRVATPLVRLKRTPSQTAVRAAADRIANMRFAFGLRDGKAIQDRRVTLVDDVMTTGATLKAAARALNEADPLTINALVVAVADAGRQDFQAV